jgi:hypothetical protein
MFGREVSKAMKAAQAAGAEMVKVDLTKNTPLAKWARQRAAKKRGR